MSDERAAETLRNLAEEFDEIAADIADDEPLTSAGVARQSALESAYRRVGHRLRARADMIDETIPKESTP